MTMHTLLGMALALIGGWLTAISAGMIVLTVADWMLVRRAEREKGE